MAARTAMLQTTNAQSQPTSVFIHTINVNPTIDPIVKLNRNQLKKLESFAASPGSLSSN